MIHEKERVTKSHNSKQVEIKHNQTSKMKVNGICLSNVMKS